MLTGRQAFRGETITDILAAVLQSEPDYSLRPANLSTRIEYLLKRCLRKQLTERLRDIGEARIWMEEAENQPPALGVRAPRRWIVPLCALAGFLMLGAFLWRAFWPRATLAWTGTFLGGPSNALGPRISPDGKTLAFQAMVDGLLQVAVMKPESGNWTVLTRELKGARCRRLPGHPMEPSYTSAACWANREPFPACPLWAEKNGWCWKPLRIRKCCPTAACWF